MTVTFQTSAKDFPANLNRLKIQHVTLYFARSSGKTLEVLVTQLLFTPEGGAGPVQTPEWRT